MTPVHNIPTEVLQEIFLFAISDRIREPSRRAPILYSCYPTYTSSTSPYSISHVCKRWRDISINFPDLWTYLSIQNPKSLNLVCFIKEWINRSSRSSELPLHLALREFTAESSAGRALSRPYREVTKAVLSVFLESLHRCKTFVLDIEIPLDDLIDAGHIQTQYPTSLDCVSLGISKASSSASRLFLSNLLRASTLLSIWIFVPIQLQDISTSWDNLQHLTFHESVYAEYELPQLLSHCRRLESLEAHSSFIGITPEHKITLPHLQRMTLNWMNGITMFLMSLKVPALSGLVLSCHHPLDEFPIVEMLTKSNATLKSLEINGVIPGDFGVLSILTAACLTGLESLRLSDMPRPGHVAPGRSNAVVWAQVILLLITSNSTTWQYFPHLQHFSLLTQNTGGLEQAHFESVAQSRLFECDTEIIRKHSSLRVSSGLIDFSLTIPPK